MKKMFSGCTSLISLNFAKFNTQNVVDFSYMFDNCTQLTELNLKYFETPEAKYRISKVIHFLKIKYNKFKILIKFNSNYI